MIDAMSRSAAYVWFDTEFSTLELDSAALLQVAAVVTDVSLERIFPVEDDLRFNIRLPEGVTLSAWVEENMGELVQACRSDAAVEIAEVDARLAALISRIAPAGTPLERRPILAGNSIHCDWRLAEKFLPRFMALLHYRHLDVTSLKLLWQDWQAGPEFGKDNIEEIRAYLPGPKNLLDGKPHDAYFDVLASIAELNFYRQKLLR